LGGFRDHLGVIVLEASRAGIRGQMVASDEHLNNYGAVHGGALMAFADELGGRGAMINLPEGAATTTIESKTNFLRAGRKGVLIGNALPLHLGRRTMVWQTTISGPDGKPVAQVTQTQLVLPGAEETAEPPAPAPATGRIHGERLKAILAAATKIFAERGFANATTREIAAAAGLHVPTMYQHVRSKDEMLERILVGVIEEIVALVTASAATAASPRDRLRHLVGGLVDLYDARKTELRLMGRETVSLPAPARAHVIGERDRLVTHLADLLREGAARGELRAVEPVVTANIILTACETWPLRHFAVGRFGLETVRATTVDLLLHGLEMAAP